MLDIKTKPLTDEEAAEKARAGDYEDLVLSMIPYIKQVGRRCKDAYGQMTAEEIVQDAILYVLEAARDFNPEMSTWFAHARQSIAYAIKDRRKRHRFLSMHHKIHRRLRRLREVLGDGPYLTEDIQRVLGCNTKTAKDLAHIGELVADDPLENFYKEDDEPSDLEWLPVCLAELDETEKSVVNRYYGLGGRPGEAIKDIAAKLHRDNKTIKQILDDAIHKMRSRTTLPMGRQRIRFNEARALPATVLTAQTAFETADAITEGDTHWKVVDETMTYGAIG